jgi:transposase InsO family protein
MDPGLTHSGVPARAGARLRGEFAYLAVVLDAFSRKVVGWALARNPTASRPLLALGRAIRLRFTNRRPLCRRTFKINANSHTNGELPIFRLSHLSGSPQDCKDPQFLPR